jgi:hypothetical protein
VGGGRQPGRSIQPTRLYQQVCFKGAVMIDASKLSQPALEALKAFSRAVTRQRKATVVTRRFRYTEQTYTAIVPQSVEHDLIDARLNLKNFEELKEVYDSVDAGFYLDQLEPARFTEGAEERYAEGYKQLLAAEAEVIRLASKL